MDKIKIRLSKNSKVWKKLIDMGGEYIIFEEDCAIVYDKDGKEICREKESMRSAFLSGKNES